MADTKTAPTTEQFEKLGVFYLGRPYDPAKRAAEPASSSTTPRTS